VAQFSGTDQLHFSHTHAPVRIRTPHFTTLPDRVKYATIAAGTGPGITAGQTASAFYTGWLHRTGVIFDNSFQHGTTPFSFKVMSNPEQVIKGFDEGIIGMKVGETRVIVIPSSLAYGTQGTNGVPANSKLIFLLTLQSIT